MYIEKEQAMYKKLIVSNQVKAINDSEEERAQEIAGLQDLIYKSRDFGEFVDLFITNPWVIFVWW